MEPVRVQLIQQPPGKRPFIHGTYLGSFSIPGPLLLMLFICSYIVFIVGLLMTIIAHDKAYYDNYVYYKTTKTRKAGIAMLVLGGIVLTFTGIFSWKAYRENKVTRGYIVAQADPSLQSSHYQGVSIVDGGPSFPGPKPPVLALQQTSDYLYSNHQ